LPPGRLKLVTRSSLTGSPPPANTIGTVVVTALAANAAGVFASLVASLGHPGGNLTGLSGQNVDLTGKRFELLREIVPGLRRLAVLFNGNNPTSMIEIDIIRTAASPLGIEVFPSEIWDVEDIAPAITTNCRPAGHALHQIRNEAGKFGP
jgi:putative ABC transport system substrate-binding protein